MKTNPLQLSGDWDSPLPKDALSRGTECAELAHFIAGADSPLVIAVDAPWGAGKTYFLRALREECKTRKTPKMSTVVFDAWRADFHNDALAAMIGEVGRQIPAKAGNGLVEAGRELLSCRGVGNMIKGAVMSASNAVGAAPLLESVQKSIEKFDPAAEYVNYCDALESFKASLAAHVAAQSNQRLVFFVDELDRCRPLFAVEVLEKIKHVFDVEGVFFVVAVNKAELAKTIQSVYGGIRADIYLRRFFNRTHPLVNRGGIVASVMEQMGFYGHFDDCVKFMREGAGRLPHNDNITAEGSIKFLQTLCDIHEFSLRDCEHVAHIVASTLNMAPRDRKHVGPALVDVAAFFAVMSIADPEKFKEYLVGVDSIERDNEFQFSKMGEDYMQIVSILLDMKGWERAGGHWPYVWAQVNHCRFNGIYPDGNEKVFGVSKVIRDYFEWARYNSFPPSPKWVVEKVARAGKFQFAENGESD